VRYSACRPPSWRCASWRRWRRCRAAIRSTPAMLRIVHGAAEPVADLRRHRLVPDPQAHAQAAERAQRIKEARPDPAARLNLQGTTLGFSTERSDDWWWLMASADSNANRLLLAMVDDPAWQADMGRLARGALGRQQHGTLGHDHRQRLGRAGDGCLLAQVRGREGHGHCQAPRWPTPARASPGRRPAGGTVMQPGREGGGPAGTAQWARQAVGDRAAAWPRCR
jgi:hypothetical protein